MGIFRISLRVPFFLSSQEFEIELKFPQVDFIIQSRLYFNSTLAINGCRIDTAYRATGGYGTYIIEHGKQATNLVSLFDPTTEVDKLCSIDTHKTAFKTWLNSLGFGMDEDD